MPPSTLSQVSALQSAAEAVLNFVAKVPPGTCLRLEVKVSSREGMSLLCAVESALGKTLARQAARELIWLSGAPAPGAHLVRLQAFGAGDAVLAEAVYEFAA